ncbi:MAG: aspartate/glutamate racemase family protein [Hyphomicrobiales bacterium]
MVSMQTAQAVKKLGVLMLDTAFTRFVGDPGNPESWRPPVEIAIVKGADVDAVVRKAGAGRIDAFVEAGQKLVTDGCTVVTTTCGFLALHQQRLADALGAEVYTSALLAVPKLRAAGETVGVLTFDAENLTPAHRAAAGFGDDVPVRGMADDSHFRAWIEGWEQPEFARLRTEVVTEAAALKKEHPAITAIVLECTNMGPFAEDVRRNVGIPAHGIVALVERLRD